MVDNDKGTDIAVLDNADNFPVLAGTEEAKEIARLVQENVGEEVGERDFARIKVPSGGGTTWQINELGNIRPEQEVYGILVYGRLARAYWAVPFEQSGGGSPPDCAAQNCADGFGIGEPGGDCQQCPLAQWGSSLKEGSNGQACKQMRMMYFLQPEDVFPTVMAVPPTSLQASKDYLLNLAKRRRHQSSVVTRFSLTPAQNTNGVPFAKINFATEAFLDDKVAKTAYQYSQSILEKMDSMIYDANDFNQGANDPD